MASAAFPRPTPHHHDRAVDPLALRQDRDQDSGHAFEKRRAGQDSHPGLTQIQRAIANGLIRLEVPGHHDFDVEVLSFRVTAILATLRGRVLSSDHRVVEHVPVRSAVRTIEFGEVRQNPEAIGESHGRGDLPRSSEWGAPRLITHEVITISEPGSGVFTPIRADSGP